MAESHPEKATALLKDMQQWRKDVGAQEMTLNPEYTPTAKPILKKANKK